MAKIAPNAKTWEHEAAVVEALRRVDVWVSSGRSQHMPEYAVGWARLTFALEPAKIQEAMERMEPVLRMKDVPS
jgi:bifunctional pyridoxal-dependent enzyme with beta-cystathionase and maltose regulon repressor activities